MKKVPLKRKTPLKRPSRRIATKKRSQGNSGASRGTNKDSDKRLKERLWELCKDIVRKRDGNICVICGKEPLKGSGWHTGHFLPRSNCGAYLKYDLRNLHSSCYYCNINLGGNGAEFYRRLVEKYGQSFVDLLFEQKKIIFKPDRQFYEEKVKEYYEISTWNKDKLLDYTRLLAEREAKKSNL